MALKMHFFKHLKNSWLVVPATFLLLLFSSNGLAAISTDAQLIGSWEVYKDDDRPNGPVPDETMSFGIDGRFKISGDNPYEGRYLVDGKYMRMIIMINGKEVSGQREFDVTDSILKFKNTKQGWVYYRRIDERVKLHK